MAVADPLECPVEPYAIAAEVLDAVAVAIEAAAAMDVEIVDALAYFALD